MSAKFLFFLTIILLVFVSSCTGTSVSLGADAGPFELSVSLDSKGKVSVSGGVFPRVRVGLGPIGISAGIQQTHELTREKPMYLFILWEDENGEVQREEYEIGKKFTVNFKKEDHVNQIRGENGSIIVVVEKPELAIECSNVVTSGRPLKEQGKDESCWLQLVDGSPTDLIINANVQITFGTETGGNDRYFFIGEKGDSLLGVTGATIRPERFVDYGYGGTEGVKEFEIQYHSPGYDGGWPTCLRDYNNNNAPLTSLCD